MKGYLVHVVRSKGLANVLPRALAIGRNFGFTEARIERKLAALGELIARYSAPLTACVTACLVQRYPATVQAMAQRGWEVAVHGKVHCDFRRLSPARQAADMAEAVSICRSFGLNPGGFRAPYLAWNEATREAAAVSDFRWTSNHALLWSVLESADYPRRDWEALERVLETLYRPARIEESVSVPRVEQGVAEIPVSLPDDEILLDRLHLNAQAAERVWLRLLDEVRGRAELLVLLFHHERVPHFLGPLEAVLAAARGDESVWLADLGEIAAWWQERGQFSFHVTGVTGRWEVQVHSSPRGTVLVSNGEGRWREVCERRFRLESAGRPTIGCGPRLAPEAVAFLRNEGFAVEARQGEHSLVLEGPAGFGPEDGRALLERVQGSSGPLLRFWRWPQGRRAALALSMDVDSITLLDFAKRPLQR